MGLSTVVEPTEEPVSIDMAKAHLRMVDSDEDGLIAGYILAARQYCENETRRPFVTRTYDYTIDHNWPCRIVTGWRQSIELPCSPVSSVTSITYVDQDGNTQTLASDQYAVCLDRAYPFIEPAYGVTWPSVRCQASAITVRFVAGWEPEVVPEPIRHAICFQVEIMMDRNPTQNSLLEGARDALLQPYRLQQVSY